MIASSETIVVVTTDVTPLPQASATPTPPPERRWLAAANARLFSDTGRIIGLDIARGLAVLGMIAAHVGVKEDWKGSMGWLAIVDGRSSILFATLAGISLTIIAGRPIPYDGLKATQARTRILVRAVTIFAIGGLLQLCGTPIAVILEYYGAMFVLALPFLRWRARRMFIMAAAVAVLAPVVILVLPSIMDLTNVGAPSIVGLAITGVYPVLLWMAFTFLGMGLGRCQITKRRTQLVMLTIGAALAVFGYGGAALASAATSEPTPASSTQDTGDRASDDRYVPVSEIDATTCFAYGDDIYLCAPNEARIEELFAGGSASAGLDTVQWRSLLTAEPHSGTPFEAIGSGGVAMAIIALCLLVGRAARRVLFPLAAVGSMALTAYVGHIVALWLASGRTGAYESSNMLLMWLIVGVVATCTAWVWAFGKGPLERLLSWLSHRASDVRETPHR